ncbi:MAG: hypothetical protein ACR2PL_07430, partial [Dehalococcoidia bacterium]
SQLASSMGVSRAYISRMFGAPPNLTLRSVAQLAIALGMTPKLIFAATPQVRSVGEIVPSVRVSAPERYTEHSNIDTEWSPATDVRTHPKEAAAANQLSQVPIETDQIQAETKP